MSLEELKIYNISMEIGDEVWKMVDSWNRFEKETLGKQFVRAADSISLNIAEGYGRFHFKEARNFCFIARGSLYETKAIIFKAASRGIIQEEESEKIRSRIIVLQKMLNAFINKIGTSKPNDQ